MDSKQSGKILRRIDESKGAIIEFLQKLVSIPSVTGAEWEIQNFMAAKLKGMGLKVDMWEPDQEELKKHPAYVPVEEKYEKRPNVVGLYKGTGGGRSLLLNGHVDVIPAGPPASWQYGPYAAEIHDNRLYGRGASDMKSGLAAMTMALDCLLAAGFRLKGDILLEYVMDEELSGNGTLACVLKGYQADAGICCETSSLHVQPACIGRVWWEITVRGKPAGIQRRFEGVNAIEKGYEIVKAVSDLEAIRIEPVEPSALSGQTGFSALHGGNVRIRHLSRAPFRTSVPSREVSQPCLVRRPTQSSRNLSTTSCAFRAQTHGCGIIRRK